MRIFQKKNARAPRLGLLVLLFLPAFGLTFAPAPANSEEPRRARQARPRLGNLREEEIRDLNLRNKENTERTNEVLGLLRQTTISQANYLRIHRLLWQLGYDNQTLTDIIVWHQGNGELPAGVFREKFTWPEAQLFFNELKMLDMNRKAKFATRLPQPAAPPPDAKSMVHPK